VVWAQTKGRKEQKRGGAGVTSWDKIEKELAALTGDDEFLQDLEGGPISMPRVPTGLYLVDHILGGGMPRGRIIEVMGQESSGKTTFVVQMMAHLQKVMGARCVFFDFEQTFDMEYAAALGLQLNKPNFYFAQPASLEAGFTAMDAMVRQDLCDVVVWDTVAAARPLAQLARGPEDANLPGVHARAFTDGLARLAYPVRRSKVVVIFVNQMRAVIKTSAYDYGPKEQTTGGYALRFYASVRLDVRKVGTEQRKLEDGFMGTDKQEPYLQQVRFHTLKNKTAPPLRKVDVPLVYGLGYDDVGSVVALAIKRGIVSKFGGGNYDLPDGTRLRGHELVIEHYRSSPDDYEKLKELMSSAGEGVFKAEPDSEGCAEVPADDSGPAGADGGPARRSRRKKQGQEPAAVSDDGDSADGASDTGFVLSEPEDDSAPDALPL
jgi:recombination protein RecA